MSSLVHDRWWPVGALVLVIGLVAAWMGGRIGKRSAGGQRLEIDERTRQLLVRADGLPWRARATRAPDGRFAWTWDVADPRIEQAVAENMTPGSPLRWHGRMMADLADRERRGNSAIEHGSSAYEQEYRVVLERVVLWLRDQVLVEQVGSNEWRFEGVTMNITAQREAEESRRASEAQLKHVIDSKDFLIWHAHVVESDGGVLNWVFNVPSSSLYRKIFGHDPTGPSLLPWNEVVSDEALLLMENRARAMIRSGARNYEQEIGGRRAGQFFWLHEQASIRLIRPGEWQLAGIITDVTTRHTAEVARQASEQTLREILERADCMIWRATVTRHGETLDWGDFDLPSSRLCTDLLGTAPWTKDDQLWERLEAPDLPEMTVRSTNAILNGQAGYEQQFRALREGRLYWLHEGVSILPVGPNEWRLVGVITDITQRHEALEAQRESEARMEALLHRVHCMIWQGHVTRRADGELQWQLYIPRSNLHRRIFGQDPDGLGFPWDQVGVPEHGAMTQRARGAILGNEPSYEQVFHVPRAEGAIWMLEQVTINRISEDHWELVGVVTDITARREAEEGQRKTEAQLQQILELAECMVWEAAVGHLPHAELSWKFYTTRSVLYRRIFGDNTDEIRLRWTKLNVPELPEMQARSKDAILKGLAGYEQDFRVIFPDRVIWLHEVVTIQQVAPQQSRLVGVLTDITAQREAQEGRKVSEAQVVQMLATVECLLWQARVFEISPGVLRWVMFVPRSRLYREIFGFEAGHPARLHWPDAVDDATNREINERSERHIFSGSAGYEQEFRAQRGDRVFWLNEQVSISQVGVGEWKLAGVITDMTARREAEQAMRASEVRYRTLYQQIPMAIVETDFSRVGKWIHGLRLAGETDLGRRFDADPMLLLQATAMVDFVDCNDTALTMLRAKTKSDFRRRRGVLSTAAAMVAVKAMFLSIWEGKHTLEAEIELLDFEGGLHAMHLHWSMDAREGQLDIRKSVMVLVDLTTLKQAEAALAAEKERLAVTLRAMAEGVITTDVEGVVQFINAAAAALTGCDPERAIGQVVTEICHFENDRTGEKIQMPVARVAVGDQMVQLPPRTKLAVGGGRDRLVAGCCAPVHSASGVVIGTVLVFRDVTEHERLEQELVRATRLESVGVLAGGIAHDFNNILTVVLGNVALAAMEMEPNSAAARSLGEAQKATLRARDLTQQLLTFAKGGEPVRAAVQLEGVVREITTFTLHGSKVRPVFMIPDDLWPADVDKGQIGRVVQNLVINAVQAMPDGGTLTVALSNQPTDGLSRLALPPGDYVQIAITDSGVGIKAEYLPRIFDPYFTTKQAGSGLGLAAVYSIINKHHGVIEVESQVEAGSTFRIWLPASQALVPANAGVLTIPQKITMKGRVLFMDDEEPIRQMATFLLSRFGFDVVCAADGGEAVARYREGMETGQPFVLVMVDLTVPGGMGGRQAMVELRQLDPAVKAIVSSGYSSDPVLANYREHGFAGVAAKPYEMGDLARVLREVLAETPSPGA